MFIRALVHVEIRVCAHMCTSECGGQSCQQTGFSIKGVTPGTCLSTFLSDASPEVTMNGGGG